MRAAAWRVIDVALVALMAAVALILLWALSDWPFNDEVFYFLAITAFALRQVDEQRRTQREADAPDASVAKVMRKPLDWVLLIILVAIMLFSLEGLVDGAALMIERVLDAVNAALAGVFAAYVILSYRTSLRA